MLLSSGPGLTPPWWPLLEKEGHALFQAEGSEQAREMARNHQPELCILDLGRPEGRETYFELGKEGLSLPPALALVPRDRLHDYEPAPGVEDFVVAPCSGEELLLRVRQLLHRHGAAEGERVLRRGDLVVDLNKYEVWVGSRPVYLTYTEYELLKFLALSPGKVFTREVLLDRVWGYDYFGGTRTVDVHIRRVRGKIEDATHSFIDTVRNVGYRFKT